MTWANCSAGSLLFQYGNQGENAPGHVLHQVHQSEKAAHRETALLDQGEGKGADLLSKRQPVHARLKPEGNWQSHKVTCRVPLR